MNPKIIQHLLRTIRKATPSLVARFSGKGRYFGERGLEKGPVRGVYDAIVKGPMNRREFLTRGTKIGIESKDFMALSKVSMGLKNRQTKAHSWLIANESKIKRFYSNPEKYSENFKKLLTKQENVSVFGTGQGNFGFPFVGKQEKRFDQLRQLLRDKYGHDYGSSTFINKAFPGAKNYGGSYGIAGYGLDHETFYKQGLGNLMGKRRRGILHFINDIKQKRKNDNPLLSAFREGLYGE
jgi:hypothetical protein